MATHDYVIDNSTGANVRADINNVLQAILTNNSSSSAPSTTAAYMFWADTTSGTLKIRNSSDNAWVELLQLDGTLTLEDGSASTPGLAFRDDLNTGIFSSAADTFNIATAGVERVEFGTATIFNDTGADVDLRIEGDTDQNLLFCNAGGNAVGIGTSTPGSKLHIFQSSASAATGNSGAGLSLESNSHQYIQYLGANNKEQGILFGDDADNDVGSIVYNHSDNKLTFATAANMRLMIDSSGRLLVGGTDANAVHANADDVIIGNTSASVMGLSIVTSTSGYATLQFSDGGGNKNQGQVAYDHSTNAMNFTTAESLAMTINSSGNVGIGTTNPGQRLEVRQTSASHAIIAANRANSDTFAVALGNTSGGQGVVSVNNADLVFGRDLSGTFTERMRMRNDGGLTFNGDTAAANALDDYEEGTWTPTVRYGSGSFIAANNAVCRYVKIGSLVHVSGRFSLTTSGSGELKIEGLPFTKNNPAGDGNSAGIQIYVEGAASDIGFDICGLVLDASTEIFIRISGSTGSGGTMAGFVDSGTTLLVGGTYMTGQ